jgi:UMF1 family MFS transporter
MKNIKSQIFGWTLYDFANTSFTVIVVTVVFPIYFKDHVVNIDTYNLFGFSIQNPVDFFWGIGSSLSYLIVAISAPILGAMSDFSSRKKKYIFYYSLLCILATIGIFYLNEGDIWFAIFLYIMGNIGFETGIVFYDAFLPIIATEDKYSKYSGYGFAMGYLGALISLMIALYFFKSGEFKLVFLIAAVFFFVSSLPFYFLVKEKKKERIATFTDAMKYSVSQVINTLKSFNDYPVIKRFITAYFFYINGVGTIIAFGGLYASQSLQFTLEQVIIFFALVQFFAMIGSVVFGAIASKIGDFKALNITLVLWMFVTIGSFFAGIVSFKQELFYSVGVLAGMSLGSSQSVSRSYYSRMIPKDRESEFFGFYAVCGRFAAIIGPFVFGIISALTGDQKLAVLSIFIFFFLGMYLLKDVPKLLISDS